MVLQFCYNFNMKITIREVATAAKVSVGTVSRVLNNDPSVSKERVEQVHSAIKSLDYTPRRKHSKINVDSPLRDKNIALVLLGMDRSLVSMPVVAAAIHGAETAVAKAGGNVLLADTPMLDQLPPVLMRSRVDGVILKGALQGTTIAEKLAPISERFDRIPSVWLLGRPTGCVGDVVSANDFTAGDMAAEYLLSRGHVNIAFINPKPDHVTFWRRLTGFHMRLEARGAQLHTILGDDPSEWKLPLESAHDIQSVGALVDKLFSLNPVPTAVFAPADSIAALICRVFASRGIVVGKDISLISCNNEKTIISGLHPTLTTIDTHPERVGQRSVEQLIWRTQHMDGPQTEILLEPTLVEGDSVATI